MTAIIWTNALLQDYLGGFQVGQNLAHRLSYFHPETGRMISASPTQANARPVVETAHSFFQNFTKADLSRRDELLFRLLIGQRQLSFHRPAASSLLTVETRQSHRGAAFGIRHVLDTAAPAYLNSDFFVSFAGIAWVLGLEDFLCTSEQADALTILNRVFRKIGMPDDTPMDEHWGGDRHYLSMEPSELLPGGPKVKVSFNRFSDGQEDQGGTHLDFSVFGINPLGPYLPGGIFEFWRLAARLMAG